MGLTLRVVALSGEGHFDSLRLGEYVRHWFRYSTVNWSSSTGTGRRWER